MLKANFRQEVCIFKVENGNKHKLITRAYNNILSKRLKWHHLNIYYQRAGSSVYGLPLSENAEEI